VTPGELPIGVLVARTAKALDRALADSLSAVGGSAATWLVLSFLKDGGHRTQGELAAAVGVRSPTLTHHLDGLERAGLVTRERDPANRRVQRVALTEAGEALFVRLRRSAAAFDGRLRAGLDDDEIALLRRLLAHLVENSRPD
jgi:MarR family transcriptional regulator, transcriptional regulator for hemolysin